MNNEPLEQLHHKKPRVKRKIFATIAMLLVAAILVSTTTYAWYTLSLRPEAGGITTTITSNGNLEIALNTKEHLTALKANNMFDTSADGFIPTTGNPLHDNVLWGNQLDLSAIEYGLSDMEMRPALLNVLNGSIAQVPVSVGAYGVDGRLTAMDFSGNSLNLDAVGLTGTFDPDWAQPIFGRVTLPRANAESGNFDKKAMIESLLADIDYGVRLAGPLKYNTRFAQGSDTVTVDLFVDPYCFAVDLLFRTNATSASLLLQTEGAARMEGEYLEDNEGMGSFIELNNPTLMAALSVVFADTVTGEVYAMAQANENGKLRITARMDESGAWVQATDDDATIVALNQNQVCALTAWCFLNGTLIANRDVSAEQSIDLKMNLQFSTDVELYPAYSGNPTTPDTPSNPESGTTTTTPDTPDVNEPDSSANLDAVLTADTFHITQGEDGLYTIYTLDSSNAKNYELSVTGTLDQSNGKFLVKSVTNYPEIGIVLPGKLTSESSPAETYAVSLHTSSPFYSLGTKNAAIHIIEADGQKVAVNGTDTYFMFFHDSNTDYSFLMLDGLDTSGVTSMAGMFNYCSNVITLDVSEFDTSDVTSMGSMFSGCRNLTELDLSSFDTSNVTDMAAMFWACSKLTNLDLGNFDTSKVTDMGSMFGGCSVITNINLSSFDTSNVTDMSTMFNNCRALTSLDLSHFNTAKVQNFGFMFDGAGLTSLNISSFDTSSATEMDYMFSGCYLTAIDLSHFNTENVTDMSGMFYHCMNLTSLDLSSFSTSNVTDMSNMFDWCEGLTTLNISNFNTQNVTTMKKMFFSCSHLTSLDVSHFDTANVTDMDCMFYDCSDLTELDVSNFNTAKVTTLRAMFNYCENLTSLDVSHFDTANVTNMAEMFYHCSRLTSLDVSNFNTAKVTTMKEMFYDCSNLTTLDLTNWSMSQADKTDMFTGCPAGEAWT